MFFFQYFQCGWTIFAFCDNTINIYIFADVLSQIRCDFSFFDNFCFTRWLSLRVSAVSFKDLIPNPPWFLGIDNISDTHALNGNSNQSLTALEIRISNFCAIHVYDISYIRNSNFNWFGMNRFSIFLKYLSHAYLSHAYLSYGIVLHYITYMKWLISSQGMKLFKSL